MKENIDVKEYRTITKKTKQLLECGEGLYVDYKRDVKSIEVSDLVAFANSDSGGFILD